MSAEREITLKAAHAAGPQRVVSHSSLPPNHIKASTLRLRQTVTLSGLYRPWFSRPVAGGPRIARRGSQKTKTKTGSEPGRSSSSRGKPDRTTNAGRGKPVRGARADKGHCEQDMRQERALNRIARNEDVTEWRRDSICSLSLDKRYRRRCLMPRSRGRDAIPYPVSQINSDRMKDGAVRPIKLHVPTHALSTRSLPRAGPCSTMAAIILHLLSLHMVRTPLLYFVRAALAFLTCTT